MKNRKQWKNIYKEYEKILNHLIGIEIVNYDTKKKFFYNKTFMSLITKSYNKLLKTQILNLK